MKVNNNYSLYSYNTSVLKSTPQSFKSAADISLKYIYEHRLRLLPQRIRNKVAVLVSKHKERPALRELHLMTYSKLLECTNLDVAKNLYPEFREVLQANAVIKKNSPNIKKIKEKMPLEDLSLYILKERWGKLKTADEVASDLGLKDRSALNWTMDKIGIPDLGKNYQSLLKASDENLNQTIAQKTKAYNKAHPQRMYEHNRNLSQRPEIKQMNKELAEEMWERMPELKAEMRKFRRDNPNLENKDFADAFWKAHPQYKAIMSRIRKEIGEARRAKRNEAKT